MASISDTYLQLADGNKIPQEGFGTYKVTDPSEMETAIQTAYDTGYRLFDTAQMYNNEEMIGSALRSLNVARDKYFVTTKIAESNQGFQPAIDSLKDSLKRLGMDYVDLILVHWPVHNKFFDTWRAFEELKKEGLTRSIGVSNYTMAHLELLKTQANEMPVLDQIELTPQMQQAPMRRFGQENGIVMQAWAPLARGQMMDNPVLKEIAANHDKTVAQVILRWQLQVGNSFIPKSVHVARIKQNADIFDFELTADEMKKIATLDHYKRVSQEPELVYENDKQYPHHFKN
ncbi:aldo/keto reductase [Limosilactobacillus difficilis]|uniref:aldo/keto reductase n=1 Tax=Limosilactobacillus difficilis TaxID=2991838 RepID=UPI0024BA6CEC|nr:aldo/keto reductase [Limosilactobacillus difficilis]